jgi:glycolate oxidase
METAPNKKTFTPLTGGILAELSSIVGGRHVKTDPDLLEKYSRDETRGYVFPPEAVVSAATAGEVVRVMRLANERNFPVTPRGAGTGLSGGALPVRGGVVLSLERMNQILSIDRPNMTAAVQPGVITAQFQTALAEECLFYPPDPASSDSCSMGGNVAENAGGARCLKYGTTKDYVLALEVVLPRGEVIRAGAQVAKDVTAYNLVGLITGSEGTLGIITEITVRVLELPRYKTDLLVPFKNLDDAPRCVTEILRRGILPAAIEFMDNASIKLSEEFLKRSIPHHEAAAHLIFEVDGSNPEITSCEAEEIGKICDSFGAFDVFAAEDAPSQKRLWEGRRAIVEAANARGEMNEILDIVVPKSRIPDAVRMIHEKSSARKLPCCAFGHVGDGNVHAVVMQGIYDRGAWMNVVHEVNSEIYSAAVAMGGRITAEHGIGLAKKDYLALTLTPAEIEIMKAIKQAFDPNGILNPGKIFPE